MGKQPLEDREHPPSVFGSDADAVVGDRKTPQPVGLRQAADALLIAEALRESGHGRIVHRAGAGAGSARRRPDQLRVPADRVERRRGVRVVAEQMQPRLADLLA